MNNRKSSSRNKDRNPGNDQACRLYRDKQTAHDAPPADSGHDSSCPLTPSARECALGYGTALHPVQNLESAAGSIPELSLGRLASLEERFENLQRDLDSQLNQLLGEFALNAPIILANPRHVAGDTAGDLRKSRYLDVLLGQTRLAAKTVMDGLQMLGLTIRNLDDLSRELHARRSGNR